jgi:hypothetical protein
MTSAKFDKVAANYVAFIQLASMWLWLCVNESTAWNADPCRSVTAAAGGSTVITICARLRVCMGYLFLRSS